MEEEEAQEEESGDLEHVDGDEGDEEFEDENIGEEEFIDEEGDEEIIEEQDGDADVTSESDTRLNSTGLDNNVGIPEPNTKPAITRDPLGKRPAEISAIKTLEDPKQVKHNDQHDISEDKIQEIVKTLLERYRDNKELLSQINKLCGSIHRLKLTGRSFAKAVISALEVPSTHKIPKPDFKQNKDKKGSGKDASKESQHQPKKASFQTKAPPKLVDSAPVKDRLRTALYAVSMFPNKFTSDFVVGMVANQNQRFSLWTLSGLFCMGLIKGRVLLEWINSAGNVDKHSVQEMDKIVHVVAVPIREKEPSLFKELSANLKQLFASGEVIPKLNDYLEKLRNNMTLPGTSPFEMSNTAIKLLEKMQKQRREGLVIPFEALDHLLQKSSKQQPTASLSTAQATEVSAQKGNLAAADSDPLSKDPLLQKLAEKLELVTKIEKKCLKVVTSSTDFIEVVHGLLNLNTHGSENKEMASVLVKCCLHEKKYNPFYAAIAKKICALKEMYKYSFQLALWEEVKIEGESEEEDGRPGAMTKLGSFAWELMADNHLDHRFFKFLDTDPLPKSSAKLAKKLLEELVGSMEREKLRVFCKKLAKLDTVARNSQKVVRYLKKQGEGRLSEEDSTKLERMVSWLQYEPNFEDPEGEEMVAEEPSRKKGNKAIR